MRNDFAVLLHQHRAKQIALRASGTARIHLHWEDHFLVVLGDLLFGDRHFVRQADDADGRLAFERNLLLQLHDDVRALARFARRLLHRRGQERLADGQRRELRGDEQVAVLHLRRSRHRHLPLAQLGIRLRAERERDTARALGNRDVRLRGHAGGIPHGLQIDRLIEARVALDDDLQVHRAALHERHLGLLNAHLERRGLGHCHQQLVHMRPVVAGVVRSLDQLDVVAEVTGDAVRRGGCKVHELAGDGRVRCGFEHDGKLIHLGGQRFRAQLHAARKRRSLEGNVPADICAANRHQCSEAVPARHGDVLAGL